MPARSKQQLKFMHVVESCKSDHTKRCSGAAAAAAKSMSVKQIKDFTSTKGKSLPKKVKAK